MKEKLAVAGGKAGLIGGGIAAALAAVYVAGGVYFGSHFNPNTTVNGINASMADVAAVKGRIRQKAEDYRLEIVEEDGTTEEIQQKDVGLAIDTEDGQIESFLHSQSGWGWIGSLFSPTEYTSEDIVSYDKDQLKKTVDGLHCVTRTGVTKTENAKPYFDGEQFVAVEEVYGTNIRKKLFTKKLGEALLNLESSIDLRKDGYYAQPEVTADSEDFQKLLEEMNQIVDTEVIYEVGSAQEAVDKDRIASWITAEDSKTVSFDDEKMLEFIDEMGSKYNTFGMPKSLRSSSGADVTVPGGTYGWKIDREGELAQLKEDLTAHMPVKRDFVYQYTAHTHDGPDYGGSYVEVNLTAQHIWLYKNGSLVVDSACVTGNTSRGNGTHAGAFQMTYKQKDATLKGEDYSTPVAFWMPFNGNEGLHDATWRSNFGGAIYKTNGSHGCVNLPYSTAAAIFPEVDSGFPVLVYTMGGTESEQVSGDGTGEASPEEQAQSVIEKINIINPVTSESGPAIKDARDSYEALSDEAKAMVTNVQTLSDAEAAYASLQAQVQESELQAQADSVADQIAIIRPVTAESGPAIDAAEAAYNALPDEAKARVGNAGDLPAIRAEYNALMGQ